MPTEKPKVTILGEPPPYGPMHDSARAKGLSLSALARELIREALELREDVSLAALAEERDITFSRRKPLSHKQIWGSRFNVSLAIVLGQANGLQITQSIHSFFSPTKTIASNT